MPRYPFLLVLYVLCNFQYSRCVDFTSSAFGTNTVNLSPAAFGDFNSDELTDLFVIKNIPTSEGTIKGEVQILLGSLKEPYFGGDPTKLSCSHDGEVTSVVPGDYDGDGLMDVLTTIAGASNSYEESYVHWGVYNSESILNCTSKPQIQTMDQPLAITYQTDLRTDLFGLDYDVYDGHRGNGVIFRLSKNGAPVKTIIRKVNNDTKPHNLMKKPHSHAFLDMDEDNYADLVLTARNNCEVWKFVEEENTFRLDTNLSFEYPLNVKHLGQLLFLDLESSDKTYAALPVISNPGSNDGSAIYVYSYSYESPRWIKLPIKFEDPEKKVWSFKYERTKKSSWMPNIFSSDSSKLLPLRYMDIATLRAGDFNNDGFVDLLATLQSSDGLIKTFLLENTPCSEDDYDISRTFTIRWTDLSPSNENAVMGVFYDFMQDGILDVIFVQHNVDEGGNDIYNIAAYKNSLDYDANFLKVMVISGIENSSVQIPASSILGKKHFFGSNLPGPKIRYRTTNQDGIPQYGRTSQLAQSAHFALHLPYSIFGLGRSPNFVEDLIIGMFNKTKQISPIIPNSQLVIRIPNTSAKDPSKWRAQLFVTPSKIIWRTIFALTGTCIVLAVIIGALHWKERREDRTERLRESQRGFHFDAM